MANLYHRGLLNNCELLDIEKELDAAILHLNQRATVTDKIIKDAIIGRLSLRKQLLSAVNIKEIVDPHRGLLWRKCLDLLPILKSTTQFGEPVDQSFSIKIQRRLASSVPPRPIVKISFDDSYAYLTKLCQYGEEAYRIFNYRGGPHLLVSNFPLSTPILC